MKAFHAFSALLHLTIFLFIFEIAAGSSYYLLEASLCLLLLSFSYLLVSRHRARPIALIKWIWSRVSEGQGLLFALSLYVGIDLAGWLAGDSTLLFSKYKVVLAMGFTSLCLLYYCDNGERLDRLLLTMGGVSLFTAVLALLNYLILRIYPICYTLRLSLRTDYNMFATTLFFGGVCGIFRHLQRKRAGESFSLAFVLYISLVATAILLSGSRRIYLLLPPVCIVTGFLWLLRAGQDSRRAIQAMSMTAAACAVLIIGLRMGMETVMEETYQVYGVYGAGAGEGILEGSGATSAAQRYESIKSPSLLEKRKLLWGIALQEMQSYSAAELLLGRGGGYNIHLYDREDDLWLRDAYTQEVKPGTLSAHSFLLADLLDGGFLKLAAGGLVWLMLGFMLLKLLRKDVRWGVFCGVQTGLVLLNSLISNRFGFLYDKFFYLMIIIIMLKLREGEDRDEGLYGYLGP